MDKQFIDEQVSRGQLYWTAEHQKELRKLHPEIIADIVKQVTIAVCDEIETEMKPVKPKGGTLYDVEHKSLHCVLDDLKKQCGGER